MCLPLDACIQRGLSTASETRIWQQEEQMILEELKKLIAADEGETLEVKESTGQRRDACETLCAFLNKDGGTVVFGVTKKGKLTGQLMADTTKRDLFDAFQKFEPAADIEVSYVPVDETHTAIVCQVAAGNCRPYIYDGKPHKRVQSSTTVMGQEEYERMLLERGGFRSEWENQPNPELSLDDLDLDAIRVTARKAVRVIWDRESAIFTSTARTMVGPTQSLLRAIVLSYPSR